VRELYGVMAAERVASGYVVTSGSFTKDAREFYSGRNIELIDGKGLSALLRDGEPTVRPVDSMPAIPVTTPSAPSCPKCLSDGATDGKEGSPCGALVLGAVLNIRSVRRLSREDNRARWGHR
jgi:restriction system protein